jgi:hypothetical protein
MGHLVSSSRVCRGWHIDKSTNELVSDALLMPFSSLASAGSELKLQSTGSGLDDLQEEFMDGRYVVCSPSDTGSKDRSLIERFEIS